MKKIVRPVFENIVSTPKIIEEKCPLTFANFSRQLRVASSENPTLAFKITVCSDF